MEAGRISHEEMRHSLFVFECQHQYTVPGVVAAPQLFCRCILSPPVWEGFLGIPISLFRRMARPPTIDSGVNIISLQGTMYETLSDSLSFPLNSPVSTYQIFLSAFSPCSNHSLAPHFPSVDCFLHAR